MRGGPWRAASRALLSSVGPASAFATRAAPVAGGAGSWAIASRGTSRQGTIPAAPTASRAKAQDRSRRRDGCWIVFIAMSLRLSEPAGPAMPRVAAHREGRSGPPAAISRRIRPYSEGRTPEAHKARASQAASRATQGLAMRQPDERVEEEQRPDQPRQAAPEEVAAADVGQLMGQDRSDRRDRSRVAEHRDGQQDRRPELRRRASAGLTPEPALSSGTLRSPRTRARSTAASRRSGTIDRSAGPPQTADGDPSLRRQDRRADDPGQPESSATEARLGR